MNSKSSEKLLTKTGGRAASNGVIPGKYSLSVVMPKTAPPRGWAWVPLSEIARLETGHTPSRKHPEYWDGDVPWIGIRDATSNHGRTIFDTQQHTNSLGIQNSSARVLPTNTVCLSRTASIGYVVVMGRPMATSQDFVNWVCSEAIDYRFLKYILLSENDSMSRFSSGTTHQTIYFPEAKAFHVCIPQIEVQTDIADVLQSLDDRIASLQETNATLEAIAQALFKSWFVDFDPVRAKMEGRAPEGMDKATAALFPDEFEESELGLVPRGWSRVPYGQLVCHTIGGDWGSDDPDEKNDTRVAIIRGTDIPDLRAGANSRVPIRYTSEKKLATRKLKDGDIVLEVSGGSKDQPTGRALYLTSELLGQFDCPVEPASFCRLLRPSSKAIGVVLSQHLTYIYSQGKTWEYQNQSTGIANFQTAHFFENELVVVPSEDILDLFVDMVRPLIERAHLTQIQDLSKLRDTLLPRLISGQLRPSDVENQIELIAA